METNGTTPSDTDQPGAPATSPAPRRWWSAGPIALGVALLFLAGAVGYLVGVRSTEPRASAVDEGFLVDMSDHHDQAVLLAQLELANGQDPVARSFATEVIIQQRQELGQMAMLMAQYGIARPDLDPARPAMGWMGMDATIATMPGLASPEDVERLRASRGEDADVLFLELMQAHHRGGIHMAEQAAQDASSPELRALADRMARFQSVEVIEYQQVLDRLATAGESASTNAEAADVS